MGVDRVDPVDGLRLLDRIDEGASTRDALRAALHTTYADLNAATADYLRKIR